MKSSFCYLQNPEEYEEKSRRHFLNTQQNAMMGRVLQEKPRDQGIISAEKDDELIRALSYYQERSEARIKALENIPNCETSQKRNAVYQSLKNFHIGIHVASLTDKELAAKGP